MVFYLLRDQHCTQEIRDVSDANMSGNVWKLILAKELSRTHDSILSVLIKVNKKMIHHCNSLKQKNPRASLQSHYVANTRLSHCNMYNDAKIFKQRLGASEYTVHGAAACVHISSLQAQTCIGWLHGAGILQLCIQV